MCDCFHIAFPNWHAASAGAGPGRRLRGPEPGTDDNSICDEASQFTEEERPRPQGSSPVDEFPESDKYGDSDKECEAEHDPYQKRGKKPKKSGLGSIFDKRSTPKMSKLKEAPSPEAGVIVKTAKDGGAEGLVYSGGGKDGIFIKEVVPESPASKNLHLKEGDQVLSATVYFDNIPYEDAIQILEHAQAYKVKLCLKRKPELTETEGALDSDAIPEDEVHPPEMREHGKKRRGDARISWPKFPTLGRGKKSRFTRSHSSSEADEQRKLELSPTTSDTESPIKSQDALKGKKKHKIKLPGLRRGRISSSEETDAQNIQTEDMISPECLESPSRETQDMEDEQKKCEKVENIETEAYKVEVVCLDSTLKTTDITAALVEQETLSTTASPDGKKKKKERSELKLKILGRAKIHKAKSSPKRLKTLGASLEKTDDKENEKTEVIPNSEAEKVTTEVDVPKLSSSKSSQLELHLPKVEIDLSDVGIGIICKPKAKGTEEKQSKTGFKLPKVGLGDVPTEEIIKIDASVEESKATRKDDAYETLLKGTELPKREDIEIPGMEDVSKITKDLKEARAPLATISDAELQAETVQMSIDVESVKEAVSKLPGYKLPKVDMSGVPIPEEITVIDANAQRISVKTPTKGKQESKSAFTEISKTTVKLPNDLADVSRRESSSGTKIDVKKLELESKDVTISTRAIISHTIEVEKVQKENVTFSYESEETHKNLDIGMKTPKANLPDLSVSKPEIKIPDFKIDLKKSSETKDDKVEGERTIFLPEDKDDAKLPDEKSLPTEEKIDIASKESSAILKTQTENQKDISVVEKKTKSPEKHDKGMKFKMPTVGISMPKVKGSKVDVSEGILQMDVEKPKLEIKTQETDILKEAKCEIELKSPDASLSKSDIDVPLQDTKGESTGELETQDGKFKLPKLGLKMPKIIGPEVDVSISKKDIDVTQQDIKDPLVVPATDVTLLDISEKSLRSEIDIKAPTIGGNIENKDSKFKMPTLSVKLPKVKAPQIDISLSRKDTEETQPKGKQVMDIFQTPDISSPEKKIAKTESEVEGQEGKFKMPKLGITMPKLKGPEIDVNLSKKEDETALRDVNTDSNMATLTSKEEKAKECVPTPETIKLNTDVAMDMIDPAIDAKASKFKIPKFEVSMPKVKEPKIDINLIKKDKAVKPTDPKAEMKMPDIAITVGKLDVTEGKMESEKPIVASGPLEAKVDIKTPEFNIPVTEADGEVQSEKFQIPRFTIAIPKVKGPEVDLSSQNKDVDVALPEAKIKGELPKVDVEIKSPEIDTKLDSQSGKFKIPKFDIKMPKVKGPEIDISFPKKEVKSPEIKADIKLPEVPKADVNFGELEVKIPDAKMKFKKPDAPPLQVKPPSGKIKIKAPDIDVSVTEESPPKFKIPSPGFTNDDVTMPKLPEVESEVISGKAEIKEPNREKSAKGSPLKFKMPTIKLPTIGFAIEEKVLESAVTEVPQVDVDIPDVKAEISLPQTQVKAALGELEVEQPSGIELDEKFKKPRFSLPRFSFSKASVPAPEVDVSAPEVNAPDTGLKIEVKEEADVKAPTLEAQTEEKGSKFKLPKFGLSMPKISAPEIDLSLSKKDTEVTLPEAKVEEKLPDVDIEAPSVEADIKIPEVKVESKTKEGSPSKIKMPMFKLPKFGVSIPETEIKTNETDAPKLDVDMPDVKAEVTVPNVDINAPSVELEIEQPPGLEIDAKFKKPRFSLPRFSFSKGSVPAPEVDVSAPEESIPKITGELEVKQDIDVKQPELEAQTEGQGSKFKLPKFGITIPKLSATDIDLSLSRKDIEVTLPEAKAEGKLPNVEVKAPVIEAEIKVPDIKVESKTKDGSPSKLKMPTFKLPKFGTSLPEMESKTDGTDAPQVDVDLPEAKAEIILPDVDVKAPSVELEIEKPPDLEIDAKFKKPRFSLPRFSFSKASAPAPELDVTAPVIHIPDTEGKVEVKGEMDIKVPELEPQIEEKGSKFKLPKFGIAMPKISAPDMDVSLSKGEVEVTLPEANVSKTEVNAPSLEVQMKAPEVKVESKTKEGSPSKLKMPTFKLPKFGASIPEVEKKDEADVVIPKVDVELPDVKVEVSLPEADIKASPVELKIEQPSDLEMDAKFKKPRFSLPRFSFSKPNVSAPEIDVNAPEVNIYKTDSKVEAEEQETMEPKIDAQIDGQGSKFKLPKFGIAMPKFSAPDIDLNISKKDFEGTLPEAQVESQLPDVEVKVPSTETEIKAPEIKLESRAKEESPSKLKMPTFKFPKFGVSIPETENKMEKTDVQLDVDLPEVKEEANLIDVDVKAPSIELEIEKPAGLEIDAKFKKPRFSLPRFSFSKASIPAPEVDAPEENVPETEAKAEVKEEIDVKASEIKAQIDGQGSKFKLPKFGIAMPKISAPEIDLNLSKAEVEVNLAEAKNESKISEVDVKTPSIEAESKAQKIKIDSKTKEGSPSKLKMPTFKLPTFGASIPEAETKTNEAEITISKVDVALPDIKAEIPPSDVDINVPSGEAIIEQPPGLEMDAKFKKPRFSLPRFSFSKASAPAPEVDVRDLDVNDLETESKMEVKVEIDEKDPELQAPIDGQRSKFKLPKFGIAMPKISAPEIDLSISKKDVEEETLSEVKTEGNLPDVEVKAPSVEADNKIPDVKVESKTKEGSPSKLKMPTFKLPKFGASIQEAEIKVEKTDVTVPQVDIDLPDIKAEVNLPDVDINAPSGEVVVEQPSGLEMDAKFKKPRFSLPRFSFSKPSVPAPDDEVNISETEGKSEVKDGVDVKAPELETQIEEQGSKFKLPKFGISMPKISAPEIDMNISKKDVDTKVDGTEVTIPQVVSSEAIIEQPSSLDIDPKFKKPRFSLPRFSFSKQSESAQEGDIDAPEVNVKELVDIKVSEPEEKRSKFKLPSLGFSTPDIDVTQKDVEIKSFPAKVDVQGGEGESSVEGSPSKFKMPSFKLPKFGVTAEIDEETPKVSTNTSDKDVKDEVKEETKESKGSWSLRKISFSKPSPVAPEVDIKAQKVDVSVSESKKEVQSPEKKSLTVAVGHTTSDIDALKKPRFSLPKISFGKQPSIETEAEVDVSLPTVEIRQTDGEETQESKFKMPTFGISLPKVKSPEIDLNLSKKDANINSPEAKIEPKVPKTDQSEVPMESPQKGASWSFPRFSFSKQVVTVESDADVKTDFTEESTLKHEANKEDDSPAVEPEIKSKFSLPRFSFSKASAKEPTIPENTVAVEVSLSEGEVKIKESKGTGPAVQGTDTRVEIQDNDAKSKDIGGSPSKFKMPIFKMPKIGITTTFSEDSNNIIKETEEILQITKDGKVVEIITQSPSTDVKMEASIKGPSMDIKSEVPKASTPDQETAQGDTLGSPSKFKLPSFKMPRLSFSKPKPDDEPADSKTEENQLDTDSKEKSKSPSTVLPSFGDFSQNIDVEIDVPNPDENLKSPSKGQSVQKQQDLLKERKQEATKSPEKTGWFKFSAFGLSSPTEAAADQKKEEKLDNKSPVDLTENDELSPSCSIQSSEAFADISSTMTSENVGISLSSPTRVTAKYSDPDSAPLAEETHSKVVMSTTKTEVISVEPNLPEKVTILSSGLSSSSEETLKLASGKIHIVTSNIQATPESQQAKMFTSIHVQSAEGVSSQDSWTVTDSQSSMSMFKESHVVRESSSESKEVVITKQITRVVTDETASSIKQLKDSVHTEKMKFFDEAEK